MRKLVSEYGISLEMVGVLKQVRPVNGVDY